MPVTVQEAAQRFLQDGVSRRLARETLAKYELLFRGLNCDFGSLRLTAVMVDDLARFREGRQMWFRPSRSISKTATGIAPDAPAANSWITE